MEQISEKKNFPIQQGKKEKKSWCKWKKTEDTSSRHRLFSIYWAWKYDIKNFRILELCLPLITELWNVEITQPFNLARGQRAKKKCNCTNHQLHKKIRSTTIKLWNRMNFTKIWNRQNRGPLNVTKHQFYNLIIHYYYYCNSTTTTTTSQTNVQECYYISEWNHCCV